MPISADEFKKGKRADLWEEMLYKILDDGQAYSEDELYEKIAVAHQAWLKEGIREVGESDILKDFELFQIALGVC